MKKVRFKLDIKGLNELMKSDEMQAVLEEAGSQVASAAGEGYGTRVHTASYVAIANVYPETDEESRENRKENTLLKAVSSAGLSMQKGG